MTKEKELELKNEDHIEDQEIETEAKPEDDDEEGKEPTEGDSEAGEEGNEADSDDADSGEDKDKPAADPIEDARKGLEEQLGKSKEALEEAREKNKFLEDELERQRQTYGTGVSEVWLYGGKHMYELTSKEFSDLIGNIISNAEKAKTDEEYQECMLYLKECNALRSKGEPLAEQHNRIEQAELELWQHEWGLVSNALLAEFPDLTKHVERLAQKIAPIFLNRKKDNDAKFSYRKLTEGDSVEKKFRYVLNLIKQEGIPTEAGGKKKASTQIQTIGKGASSNAGGGSGEKTFTRAQIAKMSLADYTRNEKAIDKALQAGRIK